MTETARRYMGNSVPRKEDPALLTGRCGPVVNPAIVDALSHEGVTHIDMPASPARVWQALQQDRAEA